MTAELAQVGQDVAGATVVVGLGRTGLSCVRFLAQQGDDVLVVDSRESPPGLDALRRELPGIDCRVGGFDAQLFATAGQLVVSPGVAWDEPALLAAREVGVPVFGDIELFARHARAPVIAITGSNGKSTVTTLVGEMAVAAGLEVRVGGNLGTPALDLLGDSEPDLYVLELSSFQLESTASLNAAAAAVLNVSDDHLDRHGNLAHYAAIKQRVYRGHGVVAVNADDPLVAAMAEPGRSVVRFSVGRDADYALLERDGELWLSVRGQSVLAAREMRIAGRHNLANALAALALGEAAGLPLAAMLNTLRRFEGLPHRCRLVAERGGVGYYNDSKGTNVGATLAALTGMPAERVVLIAGGLGKGADFAPLKPAVAAHARAVVLIGRDAPVIEQALRDAGVPLLHAVDMDEAVAMAANAAQPGDAVLLSPACASFDMFSGYAARGEAFVAAVGRLS